MSNRLPWMRQPTVGANVGERVGERVGGVGTVGPSVGVDVGRSVRHVRGPRTHKLASLEPPSTLLSKTHRGAFPPDTLKLKYVQSSVSKQNCWHSSADEIPVSSTITFPFSNSYLSPVVKQLAVGESVGVSVGGVGTEGAPPPVGEFVSGPPLGVGV